MHIKSLHHDAPFVILWTVACQAALFCQVSLQARILSGLLYPPSGNLPNPGRETRSRELCLSIPFSAQAEDVSSENEL